MLADIYVIGGYLFDANRCELEAYKFVSLTGGPDRFVDKVSAMKMVDDNRQTIVSVMLGKKQHRCNHYRFIVDNDAEYQELIEHLKRPQQ